MSTPALAAQTSESPPDTRERILLEASKLFAERGFDAPSVREICEAAGVSKPTLYYHFDSRAGVIQAAVHALHANFDALATSLFDPAHASLQGLIDGFEALFDRVDERGWMVRLWARIPTIDADMACGDFDDRAAEAHMTAFLGALPELPPHTDVEAAAWLLLGSFGPIAMHKLMAPLPISNATLSSRLVRQALALHAPQEDSP